MILIQLQNSFKLGSIRFDTLSALYFFVYDMSACLVLILIEIKIFLITIP